MLHILEDLPIGTMTPSLGFIRHDDIHIIRLLKKKSASSSNDFNYVDLISLTIYH
jgi:hypothetical protein